MLKRQSTAAIVLMGLGLTGLSLLPKTTFAFATSSSSTVSNQRIAEHQSNESFKIADAIETAKIYYNRARSKAKTGDYTGAIADYSEVIRLVPEYDKPYVNRGNLRDAQGDETGAIQDYGQAIKINPQNHLAYYNRAVTFEKLNKREEAISDYSQTINLQPNFISAHKNRGLNYLATKKISLAVQDFQNASTLYQRAGDRAGYEKMQEILKVLGQ